MKMFKFLMAACLAVGISSTSVKAGDEYEINCFIPFWVGFGPTFLAADLGYYDEENLKVNIVFEDDRAIVRAAMDRGEVDCWEGVVATYVTRPRTPDSSGVIIGAIDSSIGADGILADKSINSVADLKGKVYAGQTDDPAGILLRYALKEAGLSTSDIEFRVIDGGDAMAVYEDSSISAIGSWEPMLSQMKRETSRAGSKILLHSGQYPGLILDAIVIATEKLEAHPEKYAGFLRGIYRAIDYYDENTEKATEMMAKHYGISPAEFKESMESGVDYTSYEETVELFGKPGEKGSTYAMFDKLMELALEVDMADAPLSADKSINKSLLDTLWDGHTR
jgi:NitT/TauT family transport system substrate-binding protein